MVETFSTITAWVIPILIGSILVHGYWAKVDVFAAFVEGAAEAVGLIVRILPYIVTMYFALELLQTSGAL